MKTAECESVQGRTGSGSGGARDVWDNLRRAARVRDVTKPSCLLSAYCQVMAHNLGYENKQKTMICHTSGGHQGPLQRAARRTSETDRQILPQLEPVHFHPSCTVQSHGQATRRKRVSRQHSSDYFLSRFESQNAIDAIRDARMPECRRNLAIQKLSCTDRPSS
jgi:hypothetical protein